MSTPNRLDRMLAFDRADFLITRIVLLLAVAGTALVQVVGPAIEWARGGPLTWTVAPLHADVPLREGVESLGAEVVVSVPDATTESWIATLVPGVISTLAVAIGAWLVLRLMRRIQAGEPFVRASVWSLRGVAGLLVMVPLLMSVAVAVATRLVAEQALPSVEDALAFDLSRALWTVLAGALVAAVAEAFARGVELQRDVEGLV